MMVVQKMDKCNIFYKQKVQVLKCATILHYLNLQNRFD